MDLDPRYMWMRCMHKEFTSIRYNLQPPGWSISQLVGTFCSAKCASSALSKQKCLAKCAIAVCCSQVCVHCKQWSLGKSAKQAAVL